MTAKRIDGKAAAAAVRERVAAGVADFERRTGRPPGLATVLVGEDPASAVYVRSKNRATAETGMASFAHNLPDTTSESELLDLVLALNADERVDGILVQLPLPKQIVSTRVIETMAVNHFGTRKPGPYAELGLSSYLAFAEAAFDGARERGLDRDALFELLTRTLYEMVETAKELDA